MPFVIDDALLIAAALSAASAGANAAGQHQVNKARNRALTADRTRRAALEKRSTAAADNTLDLLTGAAGQEQQRGADLGKEYVAAQDAPTPAGAPSANLLDILAPRGSTAVVNDLASKQAASRGYTNQQALARGKLDAFGDVMTNAQIGAQRNQQDIGRAGTAAQNWSNNVLPAQLGAANTKGRNWNTLGDVLQFASMIAGTGALTAAPGVAASAASTAAKGAADYGATNAWAANDLANWASRLKMPVAGY